MTKILVRKDDPEQRIELVRWQETLRGYWGYTQTMITNHRAPCLFPYSVWREIGVADSGGTN
jgi:hypothetical protein